MDFIFQNNEVAIKLWKIIEKKIETAFNLINTHEF